MKDWIVNWLLSIKIIRNSLIEKYNNSSNINNGHDNFEEYLIKSYVYYRDNQVNDYLFQKYQTYREVMQHYNPLLKEKLDREVNE